MQGPALARLRGRCKVALHRAGLEDLLKSVEEAGGSGKNAAKNAKKREKAKAKKAAAGAGDPITDDAA